MSSRPAGDTSVTLHCHCVIFYHFHINSIALDIADPCARMIPIIERVQLHPKLWINLYPASYSLFVFGIVALQEAPGKRVELLGLQGAPYPDNNQSLLQSSGYRG